MPFLTLLRHAKAAQPLPGQKDFDRPLTERGRNDAARIGKLFVELGLDLALVSGAARTVETWRIASGALEHRLETAIEQTLYMCRPAELIKRLQEVPSGAHSVIVVGHNPCMQEVALWLAGTATGPQVSQMREKYPTAALATFKLGAPDWADLSPKTVAFERFTVPRSLY